MPPRRESDAPVLLTTPTGFLAKILETKSDEELVDWFMDELSYIFPEIAAEGKGLPRPKAIYRTKWWADPYFRGSYSARHVDTNPRMPLLLAEPIDDRLFWAGEATSLKRNGYVDGAYETGIREARRLLCLGRREERTTTAAETRTGGAEDKDKDDITDLGVGLGMGRHNNNGNNFGATSTTIN